LVKLRLKRMGKKRQPVYKIVAVDSRVPRDGKYLEAVGQYNPKDEPHTVIIDEEIALKWLGFGAQPTDTVRSLLRQTGILYKRQMLRKNFPADVIEANMAKWREGKNIPAPAVKEVKAAPAPVVVEEPKSSEGTAEVTGASSEENI